MLADQIAIAMASSHLFFTVLLPQKMGVEEDKKEGLEWLKRHSLSYRRMKGTATLERLTDSLEVE